MRIVLTGSSGLIGSALAASFEQDGAEVTRLVRRPPAAPGEVRWDPRKPATGLDPAVVSGAGAVIHLAGAPVAGGRWTDARKRVLHDSRITSTATLVTAMTAAADPPPVLLSGSAIGRYGDTGDRAVTESAPGGTGFLAELVRDWEAATEPASAAGVRVVSLRSGIVLSRDGGLVGPLMWPFRLGLGAQLGSGQQYLSWIARTDHVRATRFLLERDDISGPVNLTAPEPVTNAEFTATLARTLHRPALLTVPAAPIRLVLGELSSELLGSVRVLPERLQQAGFTFTYPAIAPALAAETALG
jgi:uncharacterized protein